MPQGLHGASSPGSVTATQPPGLSPPWRVGSGAGSSKFLNMVSQVTSPHPEAGPEPTQSHLISTEDTIIQEVLRGLGAGVRKEV